LNWRIGAKQTEDDLVVAPREFWNEKLISKIADIDYVTNYSKNYRG
jgi:hypothetical protein